MLAQPRTLFQKIWDDHVIHTEENGTSLIYIDRHLVHEVTSPQAFEGLRITERAVQRIIAELIEEGYIERIKEGRRNAYVLHTNKPLKHPVESHKNVDDLVNLIFD